MMRVPRSIRVATLCLGLFGGLGLAWSLGCGGGNASFDLLGVPFFNGTSTTTGGATTTTGSSGVFTSGTRASTDPCTEALARKFVRVSMRNTSSQSYIHYFLIMIADVSSDTHPDGAVCSSDVDLYTQFGYTEVPEGSTVALGNYCITGPSLYYFHRAGQFRTSTGSDNASLGSAISPAQGSNPTFDNFFVSGGVQVPVPNRIIFHNTGTGEGGALKVSFNISNPCATGIVTTGDPNCVQDAFYYVDQNDILAGSTALGVSSGRRVPNEIQGTGCQCGLGDNAAQALAPSGASGSSARCNEFLRGGTIEYAFLRNDLTPPIPQLVWQVTDAAGSTVHAFDSRAGIP